MTTIAAIHGIGQQQRGRQQLLTTWEPALRDGVERAVGRQQSDELDLSLDLAYYGDLFLGPSIKGTKGLAESGTLDADELAFFAEIQDEVAVDISVALPDKGIKELPPSLRKLATWLDAKFGVAGRAMFLGDLKQVRRYQDDDTLAEVVRDRVVETLRGGAEILVAHSLGSVVAFEVLSLATDHCVHTLVTLGSPLALPSVTRRLRGRPAADAPEMPPGLTRWVNVYDPSDAVACAGGLAQIWPRALDVTVDNGNDPHSVFAYLGKQATGRAISDAATAAR